MNEVVKKELPEKWEWSTLGEVCEKPQYGWTTKASQEGDLHLLRTTDITSGQIYWDTVPYCVEEPEDKEKYLIKDGDIVVSRAGSVGVSYLINNPEPSVFASYLIRFKPLIDRKYVFYFLKSPAYWNAISEKSAGIALQNVNASKLKEIDIPVAPPEQQKRIVAKIEELFSHIDAGIEALKKAKQLLKQYRQSVLKAAVTGELTKEWRETNKDNLEPASQLLEHILKERRQKWEEQQLEQFKAKGKMPKNDKWKEKYKEPKSGVGEFDIPKEWVWATYNQLGEWIGGGTPSKVKKVYWTDGNIPWISPKDMKFDYISDSEDKITEKAVEETVAKMIPQESLLFVVRSGILRRILPVGLSKVDCAVNQDLKALVPVNTQISEYLLKNALALSDDIRHTCQKAGTTVESIEVPRIQGYPIPLPPFDEQIEITRQIDEKITAIERLELIANEQIIKAERNKQSILATAFSGRLQ